MFIIQTYTETFRREKSDWNTIVSVIREFWDLRLKTKSWNFFEVRWRPYSPKESFQDNFFFNLNLANEKLGLNLSFKRNNSCAASARILGGIFKTFDMFVASEVLGHPFTDNSRPDSVDDIDLGHVVEQSLINKAI